MYISNKVGGEVGKGDIVWLNLNCHSKTICKSNFIFGLKELYNFSKVVGSLQVGRRHCIHGCCKQEKLHKNMINSLECRHGTKVEILYLPRDRSCNFPTFVFMHETIQNHQEIINVTLLFTSWYCSSFWCIMKDLTWIHHCNVQCQSMCSLYMMLHLSVIIFYNNYWLFFYCSWSIICSTKWDGMIEISP